MKKSSKKRVSSKTMADGVAAIGIDLSDRTGRFHAIDEEGKTIETGSVTLRAVDLQQWASQIPATGDGDRSWNPFSVDQPAAERLWARGDRGEPCEGGVDHAERE